MSDLELHIKALDLLIAYSESEQYDPCLGDSIPRNAIIQLALEKYYSPQTQEIERLRQEQPI
jgi:hypothetical protein